MATGKVYNYTKGYNSYQYRPIVILILSRTQQLELLFDVVKILTLNYVAAIQCLIDGVPDAVKNGVKADVLR